MVIKLKAHYDGNSIILDEQVSSLPLNVPMEISIDVPVEGIGESVRKPKRVWGQFRGMMKMSPDFNDELPDSFWLGEE